jgi:hypothetical protein
MHKESFIINLNTLLHVSTLLGHLQGEHFCYRYTKVALYTLHSTVKCNLSVTITKKFPLKMTQQDRNM